MKKLILFFLLISASSFAQTGFYESLKTALPGDTIQIPAPAVWRIQSMTVIPEGVTIIGNGATLYNDSLSADGDWKAMLITGGPNVSLINIRIKGASAEIGDHSNQWCIGIRADHPGLIVKNCEIFQWNKIGVWLRFQNHSEVSWNYIHHCRGAGYGYGIWTGGAGSDSLSACLIQYNLFEANRAAIDGSGHKNSYVFQYNSIMRQSLYYPIKRHGSDAGYYGGINTFILDNIVLSTQQAFELPFPWEGGECIVANNYFAREDSNLLAPSGKIGALPWWQVDLPNVTVVNNKFGQASLDSLLPHAQISSPDFCYVGDRVRFSGSKGSRYIWRFGAGNVYGNEQRVQKYDMTYMWPGGYTVSLTTIDNLNRPSIPCLKKFIVKTTDMAPSIVFSIKDSYLGRLSGFYIKQLLVDGEILWQDDVAGEEGWTRCIINVSKFNDGKNHSASFRILCKNPITDFKNQIQELDVYLDDVSIVWGSSVQYWNFEDSYKLPVGWSQKTNDINCPGRNFSTTVTTADFRSGEQSLRIGMPYGATTCSGFNGSFNLLFKVK